MIKWLRKILTKEKEIKVNNEEKKLINLETLRKTRKISLYILAFIIYEEIVLSCLVFKTFPTSIIYIILFSIPIAMFINIITSLGSAKFNKILIGILMFAITIIFGTQLIYYKIYEAIVSVFSMVNGGQVFEFFDTILNTILKNWYGIILIFLPLIIFIILAKKKILCFEKVPKIEIINKFIILIAFQVIAIASIMIFNNKDIYSRKNLYFNIHTPTLAANKLGVCTEMRLDFKRLIFGFEDNIKALTATNLEEITDETDTVETISQDKKYNVLDIDFQSLIKNEKDKKIVEIYKYMYAQEGTNKNKYTGMFEGKNLIVFVAESFSSLAINKDLTPNLYKLYNEGFQFDNFYTPIFPVSTADGEYIADTSLLPKEGIWSLSRLENNYMPYSYANVFESLGYSSNAYHDHTYDYYDRQNYISGMGYNSYLAVGTGLEDRMNCKLWPNSDYEMIDVTTSDYINNEKFIAYYMSVSGHLNYYKDGNNMVERNWSLVENLPYSELAKGYLACNIELDKAIGELINDLTKANKLDDTVIAISGDHYPYGLTLEEINELSTYERDDAFEKYHMPFLVWNNEMSEPIKVNKLGSSLDILPTILNLFGVEYDSRLLMGTDILSDNEPLVIFSNRSFISSKGRYNALTNTFLKSVQEEVEEQYVNNINLVINSKFKISRLILEEDFYRKLWTSLNWIK